MQIIAYTNDDGGVSIVIPADETHSMASMEEIAQKDVPEGKQYIIINSDRLPSRSSRATWVIRDGEVVAQ